MGGLAKSMVIMALIINYFHDEAKYYELMIDSLFDVDDLYKYFQYFNPNNKNMFKKYRDSIILRNAKHVDDVKREDRNFERNNNSSFNYMRHNTNNFINNNEHRDPREHRGSRAQFINPHNFTMKDLNGNGNTQGNSHINPKRTNERGNNQNGDNINTDNHLRSSISDANNEIDLYVQSLKQNEVIKNSFTKIQHKKFTLNAWEIFLYILCPRKMDS
jgi:hypothetical protein